MLKLKISIEMGTMLELAIQEFVRSGGKLGDGLSVNEHVKDELLAISQDILQQISKKRNNL